MIQNMHRINRDTGDIRNTRDAENTGIQNIWIQKIQKILRVQ